VIGGHDLGGQPEMGAINPEPEAQEPVFHADWERRVFALTIATGMLGKWNIDESRHARERQDPLTYVQNSYYENWLEGLETLLLEKGLVDTEELVLATNISSQTKESLSVPNPILATKILASGAPSTMETDSEPLYCIGDSVLVKASQSAGHTRAPKYTHGVIGTVAAQLGCHSFPDSNAQGVHEGKHLYRVVFNGCDLWSSQSVDTEVLVDLWEPYLEVAAN
jgi:nitrile hydratase beta subunit